jgi:mono/diheme cytochrome c family protein
MRIRVTELCTRLSLFLALLILWAPAIRAQGTAEATYKVKCAGCHGVDGAGTTGPGKALGARDFQSPEVQKESVDDLAGIITNGKNKMPKYADKLKDAEIKDLAAYVHGLGKK